MSLRDVQLPSGATLRIQAANFATSKALLSAIAAEFRSFNLGAAKDFSEIYKDIACAALSSPVVDKAIWACMAGCLYVPAGSEVPLKLAADVFEPVERRDDLVKVYLEILRDNVGPFMKSLYALWSAAQEALSKNDHASAPKTMTFSSTSNSAETATPPA